VKYEKYKQIEVEEELFVPFNWKDDTLGEANLGRAEFGICLKMLRGKLREFWIYPFQQRMDEYICWHCKANEYNDFQIASYEGLSSVGAWLIYPFKKHKSLMFRVAAPNNSRYLRIEPSGISFWRNCYDDEPFTGISKMMITISNMLREEEPKELIKKLKALDR